MKLTLILLLFCFSIHAQDQFYAPFENYDLASGDYQFIGSYSFAVNKIPIVDSLKQFYIDDLEALKWIKENWRFNKYLPAYECGYDYNFYLVKNGEVLDSFSLNIECRELVTKIGSFDFDIGLLSYLIGKTKPIIRTYKKFENRKEGLLYLDSINQDSKYLAHKPKTWIEFEGKFEFKFDDFQNFKNAETLISNLENKIERNYGKKFQLDLSQASPDYFNFYLFTTKEIYKAFDLFEITREWEPLKKIDLITYWRGE
ncbi:hypothetical protein [Croceivirga thetidis]|uniref:Uncharacterized protein n=1 Tax=Croceivirga thetidis TaxID=2721623 RepID=A0ABX1GRC8_9FLAO|nr:hypothetical protein [Croceivirga thetidis]NKI32503.1 hypothetical protein [Croceivirga thetidis]